MASDRRRDHHKRREHVGEVMIAENRNRRQRHNVQRKRPQKKSETRMTHRVQNRQTRRRVIRRKTNQTRSLADVDRRRDGRLATSAPARGRRVWRRDRERQSRHREARETRRRIRRERTTRSPSPKSPTEERPSRARQCREDESVRARESPRPFATTASGRRVRTASPPTDARRPPLA